MILLSLILPIGLSLSFLQLICPSQNRFDLQFVIHIFLSVGIGLGISSLNYWAMLNIIGEFRGSAILIEIFAACASIAAALYARFFRSRNGKNGRGVSSYSGMSYCRADGENEFPLLKLSFYTVAVCSVLLFVTKTLNSPHGSWDAWAIWNMRARFLFRSGENWTDAFAMLYSLPHRDYPLLIPASISRIWNYLGSDDIIAPSLVAFLFASATVGLMVSSTMLLKNRNHGYLTGLLLLTSTYFVFEGAGQVSDVPLGFFILSTIVLFILKDKNPDKGTGLCFLAGLAAGLSAWTKNEGILFVVIVLFCHFVVTIRYRGWSSYWKDIIPILAGLVPVLLFIIHFKMRANVSNYLFSDMKFEALLQRLVDMERYLIIGKAYWYYLLKRFAVIVLSVPILLLVLGLSVEENVKTALKLSSLILFLLLSGYFAVYLITPLDLDWQLRTSLPRLYLHVMPSFVFIFCAALKRFSRAD